MKHFLAKLIADDSGQDMIEYGLIAAIVALGTATVIRGLDNSIKNSFSGIENPPTNAFPYPASSRFEIAYPRSRHTIWDFCCTPKTRRTPAERVKAGCNNPPHPRRERWPQPNS